jgi:predicted secreted hydrolase
MVLGNNGYGVSEERGGADPYHSCECHSVGVTVMVSDSSSDGVRGLRLRC